VDALLVVVLVVVGLAILVTSALFLLTVMVLTEAFQGWERIKRRGRQPVRRRRPQAPPRPPE
jgi:hypothetical protein